MHFEKHLACLHDQNKNGFFGGPAFSSQSELFENFSDCSEWIDKSRALQKSHFCFDHVNWLTMAVF